MNLCLIATVWEFDHILSHLLLGLSICYAIHVERKVPVLIFHIQYWAKSTNYEAPRYVISLVLLLLSDRP
jgi:hypothetical protein